MQSPAVTARLSFALFAHELRLTGNIPISGTARPQKSKKLQFKFGATLIPQLAAPVYWFSRCTSI
jgi:hypothetical protein